MIQWSKPELLIWAAGFFDGEGSISCNKVEKGYSLSLSVSQVDRRPLERFLLAVGGIGAIGNPSSGGGHSRPISCYRTYGPKAITVAMLLFPYLCEPKQEQIKRALDVYAARPLKRGQMSPNRKFSDCKRKHGWVRVYVAPDGSRECLDCRDLRRLQHRCPSCGGIRYADAQLCRSCRDATRRTETAQRVSALLARCDTGLTVNAIATELDLCATYVRRLLGELVEDETLDMKQGSSSNTGPKPILYWLRVPPTMRTAHQAVSWTFEETPKTYQPAVQT